MRSNWGALFIFTVGEITMSFRRYNWFFEFQPQKTIDEELPKCPFCGESPNWLLDVKKGVNCNFTCMCEKCQGKLYTEVFGMSMDKNMRIVDLGMKNLNNLSLNAVYHIKSLDTIAQNTFSNVGQHSNTSTGEFGATPHTTYTPSYTEQQSKNNKTAVAVISVISIILFIGLMVWILLPSGGSGASQLEPVQKSSMQVEEIAGYYYVTITGSAKNTTSRTMSYVSITFTLYDSAGNVVGTAIANQAGLNAGKTWVYSATGISTTSRPVSCESTDVTILYD